MSTAQRQPIVQHEAAKPLTIVPAGWGGPDPDGTCHYFQRGESLCEEWTATDITEEELIQCDPLALENCPVCRTVLLLRRGLIVRLAYPVEPQP